MCRVLVLSLVLLLTGPLLAQDDLTVLPADGPVAPRKMLSTFLLDQAQKQFDARRAAVAAMKTPGDVERRQKELRTKFLEALGGFPDRTPLNTKVVSRQEFDGYTLEKVVYESRPDHHVTALLYLPAGKDGRVPGVILPCGHSLNGKASEAYQRACVLLARNGIAALCYDPIGQGERRQLLDNQGNAAIQGSTSEHTLIGVGALLVGQGTATYRIWDGVRSLDYLASRPEVDPKLLGCTGVSGGGTLTSYLMALDDRIQVAAPSCYLTSLERLFATIGPQDAEQNITGQVAFGMEHADYVTMRAPKPTLILAASRDFFDIQGTWTAFREAKRVYGVMDHSDKVDLAEFDTTHGYPKPQREAMARWMCRWLLHKDSALPERDEPVLKDAELLCTRSGQVLEDFKGKSAFHLNLDAAEKLATERAKAGRSREELLKEVRRLLAVSEKVPAAKVRSVGSVKREGYEVFKTVAETEPGVEVPALIFVPRGADKKTPKILYLHESGKAVEAGAGGQIEQLLKAGNRVVAVDLRGFGETAPAEPPKTPGHFGVDFKETFLSLHLNRPLLGQRVFDVLSLIEFLSADGAPVRVHGVGSAGLAALHAAALDERVREVTLERTLVSWENVARTPISVDQLSSVVPGALKVYDLPELAALVSPRPLTILRATDAARKPVTQAALDEAYAGCKESYTKARAEKAVLLKQE